VTAQPYGLTTATFSVLEQVSCCYSESAQRPEPSAEQHDSALLALVLELELALAPALALALEPELTCVIEQKIGGSGRAPQQPALVERSRAKTSFHGLPALGPTAPPAPRKPRHRDSRSHRMDTTVWYQQVIRALWSTRPSKREKSLEIKSEQTWARSCELTALWRVAFLYSEGNHIESLRTHSMP
jgi:hypothetical protein